LHRKDRASDHPPAVLILCALLTGVGLSLGRRPAANRMCRRASATSVRALSVCLNSPATDDVKAILSAETDAARALGIFGWPTFTVSRELFWVSIRTVQRNLAALCCASLVMSPATKPIKMIQRMCTAPLLLCLNLLRHFVRCGHPALRCQLINDVRKLSPKRAQDQLAPSGSMLRWADLKE
jgi:hypothetical protein